MSVPLGASDAGDEAQSQLRKSESGFLWAENNVSEKGQFKASSECHSIDSWNDGLFGVIDGVVEFLEDIIVLEIFGTFVLELLDVGSCAEGLGDFTEEEDDLDIIGGLMGLDGIGDGWPHFNGEGVEVGRTVEVDVADFILDFGFDFVELDPGVEGVEQSADLSHIFLITAKILLSMTEFERNICTDYFNGCTVIFNDKIKGWVWVGMNGSYKQYYWLFK